METAMTLLYNPESMALVADQIVRQVFGNLVTIKSWTDLWFAEGLHMYLSNVLVNSSMTGDVELFRSDVTDYIISVFDFDSLEESLPVSYIQVLMRCVCQMFSHIKSEVDTYACDIEMYAKCIPH